MTQTKDKKPDDETEHGGGRSRWELSVTASPVRFQINAARFDADDSPIEHWIVDVTPGNSAEKALIDTIKQVGVDLTGVVSIEKSQATELRARTERKSLELGDMIPCEVCGAATSGALFPQPLVAWNHDKRVHDRVRQLLGQPDEAGRVFCETPGPGTVAVCLEREECWDAFWTSYTQMHERAAGELGVMAWGRDVPSQAGFDYDCKVCGAKTRGMGQWPEETVDAKCTRVVEEWLAPDRTVRVCGNTGCIDAFNNMLLDGMGAGKIEEDPPRLFLGGKPNGLE